MVGILRLPAALGVVTKCLTSRTSNAHKLLFVISLYHFYAVVGVPANNLYAAINSLGSCSRSSLAGTLGVYANNGNEVEPPRVITALQTSRSKSCRLSEG